MLHATVEQVTNRKVDCMTSTVLEIILEHSLHFTFASSSHDQ